MIVADAFPITICVYFIQDRLRPYINRPKPTVTMPNIFGYIVLFVRETYVIQI